MPQTPNSHPGGKWVPKDKVHPMCNVSGRAYRREDGSEGVAYEFPIHYLDPNPAPITHWYFAAQQERDQ